MRSSRSSKKTVRLASAFSAVAVMAATVGMAPTPTPMMEAQYEASHRTVTADYTPLGVFQYQVPGTGSTVANPPSGMPDMKWLDSGVWNQIPDGYALLDNKLYPATLEQSGPKSGENSVRRGSEALLAEILKKDPKTTVIGGAGGSQGALVWAEALRELEAMGYPMENVFVVFYSDPGMPGTGILSRYSPRETALTTGLHGGATQLPEGGTYVRIVNAGDPMAFFPKDPWNVLAVANAVAGFVFEHGAIGKIDYANATITTEGNVTTVVARPYGDVVSLVAPLVMLNMPHQLVRFVNELIAPLVYAGGMYEEGHIQQNPSLQSVLRQIEAVATGIRNALDYAARLVLHMPTPVDSKNPSGYQGSPVQDLIDKMHDRDEELNGPSEPADNESVESNGDSFAPLARTAQAPQPEQSEESEQQPQLPTEPLEVPAAEEVAPEPIKKKTESQPSVAIVPAPVESAPVAPSPSEEAPEPEPESQTDQPEAADQTKDSTTTQKKELREQKKLKKELEKKTSSSIVRKDELQDPDIESGNKVAPKTVARPSGGAKTSAASSSTQEAGDNEGKPSDPSPSSPSSSSSSDADD